MLVSLRLAKGTRGQRWKELGSLSPGRVLDRGGLLVFQQEKCFILRLRLGWGWDWGGIRRRCSAGLRRLRVEGNEQEKRELCFEKKLSHSCGGMPAVRVTPRLSPAPADTHPQGEQAGLGVGSAGTCKVKGAANLLWDGSCWCFPHQLQISPPKRDKTPLQRQPSTPIPGDSASPSSGGPHGRQ